MPDDPGESAPTEAPAVSSRRRKWIEIAIVVLLAIFPAVRLCFLPAPEEMTEADYWRFDYAFLCLELVLSLLWILPAGVLILVAPEGPPHFGVRKPRWKSDLGLGVIGMLLCLAAYHGLNPLLVKVGWQERGGFILPVQDASEAFFCVICTFISCFGQELTCRAHLQTRLGDLLGPWIGIPASIALFTSFHLYQGAGGVAHAAAFGLILALLFRFSKSLWTCVVAHTLWNISVFMVPQ
ncbi:MAG: CPBP family intramembrane glutamic endopeptidase [Planctomycetota bacterium]